MVHSTRTARSAFTLIELLVVIAIIAVLVSLLLAAVMKALSKGEEVQTRSDLSQLTQAVSAFQVKFGIKDPPPSRLKLCKLYSGYDLTKSLDKDSVEYLTRLWPRLTTNVTGTPTWAAEGNRIDWDGSLSKTGSWTLQGQECLVFFLGGIPSGQGSQNTYGCTGFATSPSDPSLHVKHPEQKPSTIPPFFSFNNDRLVIGQSGRFFAYKDPYNKTPFAYFSSYKTENGYNRYGTLSQGGASDCAALPGQPWPYARTTLKYMNPNSFQIVSAGRDGGFGGGSSNPDYGGPFFQPTLPMYGFNEPGYDDVANFYDKFLGIPPD